MRTNKLLLCMASILGVIYSSSAFAGQSSYGCQEGMHNQYKIIQINAGASNGSTGILFRAAEPTNGSWVPVPGWYELDATVKSGAGRVFLFMLMTQYEKQEPLNFSCNKHGYITSIYL